MVLSSFRYSCDALCALPLGSCQPPGSSSSADGTLLLGAAGAWRTACGRMAHRSIALAVEELNQQGAAGGRTIGVTYREDQAEGDLAADIAREFVDDPRITGVIGHLRSTAMVAAARVYDGRVPVLSPSATSPDLSGASTWLFRLNPSDPIGRTMQLLHVDGTTRTFGVMQ